MESRKAVTNLIFIKEMKNENTGKPEFLEITKKATIIIENISNSKYYAYQNRNQQIDKQIKIRDSFLKYTDDEQYQLRYIIISDKKYEILKFTKVEGKYNVLDLLEVV